MNKNPQDLYNEIDKLKQRKYDLTCNLENNCSKKVDLYFSIRNHTRTITLEDHFFTHSKRRKEFDTLRVTIDELETEKKEETTIQIKLDKINVELENKLETYDLAMKEHRVIINQMKEKFYEELDVIFNAKCLICYEVGIPVKLNIPCCLPDNSGSLHCAGSFCLSCCKKLYSVIDTEVKCPVCRSIYTRQLLSMNLYVVDQDKIRLIDKYITNFWKKHTIHIENINEIPKLELKILNCDKCDKGYDSLFDIFRHQTGKTSTDICAHALVPCKICKFLFCRKDVTNNYCSSCLYI